MRTLILLTALLLCSFLSSAQELFLYKEIDTVKLYMEVYKPPELDTSNSYPAMAFFFGGGWVGGNRSQFLQQAKYFSERGVICFLVDYRTRKKHQTTPFDAVEDAKSAIRFIRKNAEEFNVDKEKIIASGGSAGGHLAAAAALLMAYNDESDDLSVSAVPNALVLFNPVIDNGPGGYAYERVGEEYKEFSPLHNIRKGAPPTIVFLGTEDKLIPVETANYYKMVMEKVGSRCDLLLYKGQGHGFFNYEHEAYFEQTVAAADQFLVSLGFLSK